MYSLMKLFAIARIVMYSTMCHVKLEGREGDT